MKMPIWSSRAVMSLVLAFGLATVARALGDDSFAPCWRGNSATTFQNWSFQNSNNPAAPLQFTNASGTSQAVLTRGSFSTGWKSSSFGGLTGVWDLGRSGQVSLTIPNVAGASNSWKYVYVQVTYFEDSLAFAAPTIALAGATFVSSSVVNNLSAPPGNWKTLQSVWLIQPAPATETVVVTGSASKGLLVDQIIVDTRSQSAADTVPAYTPCWRGQSSSTFQSWAFGVSNSLSLLPADLVTNAFGLPQGSLVLGAFSSGYIQEDSFLGCVQGIWDLGRAGTLSLTVPNTNAPSLGSYSYVEVQVTQFRDSSIYTTNALVSLAGGVRVSQAQQLLLTNAYGGQWVVEKTIWRLGAPSPASETVVVTGGVNGSLIDSVVIDSYYLDQPVVADLVVSADPGSCLKSNVSWVVAGVDGCVITNVSSAPASGSSFSVGTNLVTYILRDGFGGSYTNNFHVVVQDLEPPVVTCPSNLLVAKSLTNCGAIVSFTTLASDNCSVASVVSTPASGSLFPVGLSTVSSVAYDASGNTSSICQFQVQVVDYSGDLTANQPCWRGQTNTTFQQWAFSVSNQVSALSANLITNPNGTPQGSVALGLFSAGYIDQDPFLGCVQGIWDLGRNGQLTLNIPNTTGASSNAFKYIQLQVTQFRDSSIYTSNAAVAIAGAVRVSQQQQVLQTNAFGGSWVVEKTVWRFGSPSPASESIVLTGGAYGSLIDQVVVDTLVVDQPVATNLVYSADAGYCEKSNVVWSLPALDGCIVTNVTSNPTVGSTFSVGTNWVTYIVRDSLGGRVTNLFSVTITDDEFPVALTQNISVNLDSLGQVAITAAQVDNGSLDNCGIAARSVSPNSFTCGNLGSNIVTFVVTDIHGHNATNLAVVYVNDLQAPTITNLLVLQGSTDVKNCAAAVLQGAVVISLQSSDNCSLSGNPAVVLTNGANSAAATFVNESPTGTFNYLWNVTGATANGTWQATVAVADSTQVTSTNFTLCLNKAQVAGQIQLQNFFGTKTVPVHSRTVVFVATTNNPTAGTNVLMTWNLLVTNISGDTFPFTLTGVPPNANGLSAKTAWNLRRKLPMTYDTNLQGVVSFTTTNAFLRGGDITGDNFVNTLDLAQINANFTLTNAPAADINGDGIINTFDRARVLEWFGRRGDPQ